MLSYPQSADKLLRSTETRRRERTRDSEPYRPTRSRPHVREEPTETRPPLPSRQLVQEYFLTEIQPLPRWQLRRDDSMGEGLLHWYSPGRL